MVQKTVPVTITVALARATKPKRKKERKGFHSTSTFPIHPSNFFVLLSGSPRFSLLSQSLFSPSIFSLNKNNAEYFDFFSSFCVCVCVCVCVFRSIKLFVDLSKISMDFQWTRNLTRVL